MNIKIKKLHEDAVTPKYAKPGDAGFDLYAVEDKLIQPGETAIVKIGLAFQIPEGYELQVRPRSGISSKTKLRVSNSPGTIDAGYRGEVGVIFDNIHHLPELPIPAFEPFDINHKHITGATQHLFGTYLIRKGDRIAQGVVSPIIHVEAFEEVDELDETERGTGGFGSTGVL